MRNPDRPYMHIVASYKGHNFLIPFRSKINHRHGFIFNNKERKGLDFTKAIIMSDLDKYSYESEKPIPQKHHDTIVKKQDFIIRKFKKYVDEYCKYTIKTDENYLRIKGRFSTLQNFHEELGITSSQEKDT